MATREEVIEIFDSDDENQGERAMVPKRASFDKFLANSRPMSSGECAICFCEYTMFDGVSLSECGHAFCYECISTYVASKARDGQVLPNQMICPLEVKSCGRSISQRDVLVCLKSDNDRDRYLRLTVERFVEAQANMGCCPTAGCSFLFEWDENNAKLDCPSCRKTYCLRCQASPWHEGISCEENQRTQTNVSDDDIAFEKFASTQKLKQCPKCKFWVEKSYGCDAMHCRCNLVFCYKCGGCLKNTAIQNGFPECRCLGAAELLQLHEQGTNHNLLPHRYPLPVHVYDRGMIDAGIPGIVHRDAFPGNDEMRPNGAFDDRFAFAGVPPRARDYVAGNPFPVNGGMPPIAFRDPFQEYPGMLPAEIRDPFQNHPIMSPIAFRDPFQDNPGMIPAEIRDPSQNHPIIRQAFFWTTTLQQAVG